VTGLHAPATDNRMETIHLQETRCAICGSVDNAETVYPANLGRDAFTPAVFSARRTPDRIHYQIVRCLECGLLRSDPVASAEILSDLYSRSEFHYADESTNLAETYGRYLDELDRYGCTKEALLEIGCGNGFFLEEARRRGYAVVRGVEPSADAVAQAPAGLRAAIVVDVMRPGLFDEQSFDAICLFQVLDHLTDPARVLNECRQLLRPGGFILCLNHDVEAMSARLLGERSPIIDVEHTYLFSKSTISRLLAGLGFRVLVCGPVRNTYSLRYLSHLLPLPRQAKNPLLAALDATRLGRVRLSVRLGNLYAIAQRSDETPP
jgi:SAM-dependent methyltransferase